MDALDKIAFMQAVEEFLNLYQDKLKKPMADIVDDHKIMNITHTGMVELASYHMARAAGELAKLDTDWRINNG